MAKEQIINIEIYNSRNLIWFYTQSQIAYKAIRIYNSRNLIWSYTGAFLHRLRFTIYNSRNLIWSYTICWQKY